MTTKIIDAKCPYCGDIFSTSAFGSDWARSLWGEYAPHAITHACQKCKKESTITVTKTYRYTAKKLKTKDITAVRI